ncbi:uncharacterized protein LOC132316060 isoform X2 [Cornus florida]|uniref:uncharacterized protein LOC132316060 isoform X2 n=1 Tax=Cornus florida TaxID=4283 RepID=UPI00289D04AF|nr:uncharacterized protein LOC132316060 isoform X2 [Cornus florida]
MSSWSIGYREIPVRRSARIARCANACKSRDGDADSPTLQMAGVNRTPSNFKLVACSSRRMMKSSTRFLPEEIIFNILLWLPAEVLYNVMRYVCREWYNVINDPDFINAHLQKSTGGILIRSRNTANLVYSVQIHNCDVQIRELGPEFPLHFYGSCDGLVFSYCIYRRIYSVLNPITNQLVNLPPFYKTWSRSCVAISYVRSMGRYKVMVIIRDENNLDDCLISTVGTDNAWRQIDIKHLPDFRNYLLCCATFSTGGYIYATRAGACHLFALDAEAEIFHQFNVPSVCLTAIRATYVVWKSYLSLLLHCGEFVWELWALTELSTESGAGF